MSGSAPSLRRPAWPAALVALALVTAVLAVAPAARAGQWAQVACVNPDGSPAPSEGWTGVASGAVSALSTTSTRCGPSTPMIASLSSVAPVPNGAAENLQYTPPAGSSIVGGSVSAQLYADGYNTYGRAVATVNEPGNDISAGDGVFSCVYGYGCGGNGAGDDYDGTVTLPSDLQGDLYVQALCTTLGTTDCDSGGSNGAWALARVRSAAILLSSSAAPTAAGFSGSALQGNARGTAQLVFSASDPGGPGVYRVAVAVDGTPVYDATPDGNDGACVPVGTYPGTGALMFDHQQPCPQTASVDAPVPTAGLTDGDHRLTVAVADASGNSATVLDQLFTTHNPQVTPRPRRGVRAQFVISWHWYRRSTLLRSIAVRRLPRSATVAVRCAGARCPRLHVRRAGARHVGRLLRSLHHTFFPAGDRILLTVSQRHHPAEHVELEIRRDRIPRARVNPPGRRRHRHARR